VLATGGVAVGALSRHAGAAGAAAGRRDTWRVEDDGAGGAELTVAGWGGPGDAYRRLVCGRARVGWAVGHRFCATRFVAEMLATRRRFHPKMPPKCGAKQLPWRFGTRGTAAGAACAATWRTPWAAYSVVAGILHCGKQQLDAAAPYYNPSRTGNAGPGCIVS